MILIVFHVSGIPYFPFLHLFLKSVSLPLVRREIQVWQVEMCVVQSHSMKI